MEAQKIKYEILYQYLEKLRQTDCELDRALSIIDVKLNHPGLYAILEHFDSREIKYKINLDKLCKRLDELIIDELIEFYEYKTGKKVDQASKWPILYRIPQEMDLFMEQCHKAERFDEEIKNLEKKIIEVGKEYLALVGKNIKEFKMDFKLNYDRSYGNLLCSKAQTCVLKKRFIESDRLMKKYGNRDVIRQLEEERRSLEEENKCLKNELDSARARLKRYESLDSNLMKEYLQLKGELDCRRWALRYNDRSNSSIGSVE